METEEVTQGLVEGIFKGAGDINSLRGFLALLILAVPVVFLVKFMIKTFKHLGKNGHNGNHALNDKEVERIHHRINAVEEDLKFMRNQLFEINGAVSKILGKIEGK